MSLNESALPQATSQPARDVFAIATAPAPRLYDRMELEAACVDLICQLESFLSQVAEARSAGYLIEVVPVANKMLLTSLDFGDRYLTDKPLEDLKERVVEAYQHSKELGIAVQSRSWKTVRSIIGRKSATQDEVQSQYQRLGESVAVVVVASLGAGIELLGTDTDAGLQMLQSLKLFIAEMKKGW